MKHLSSWKGETSAIPILKNGESIKDQKVSWNKIKTILKNRDLVNKCQLWSGDNLLWIYKMNAIFFVDKR